MTKKRSKCLMVLFAILLVVCFVACFVNFTYPISVDGNYYSYSNFISNLKLGEDVSNSMHIVYKANEVESTANFNQLRESTMLDLKNILNNQGYKDVIINAQGEDLIAVTVGNILTRDEQSDISTLLSNMSNIYFSMSANTGDAFATRQDVEYIRAENYVNPQTGERVDYVSVKFKDYKKESIAEATSKTGTLYIYLGDEQLTSFSLSEPLSQGFINIQSDSFDVNSARTYANKMNTGLLDLELVEISSDIITPSLGIGAGVLAGVVILIAVVAVFIYLIAKYRMLGLTAVFALMFNMLINLFLLQSIPLVHVNFAGLVGLAVMFLLSVECTVAIFESAKTHYQADTKLYISLKVAQKENLMRTFILSGLIAVVGLVSLFMPVMSVQSFGWVMLVGSVVNVFTTLALNRLFINMYLPFNSTDGAKCNFYKGGKNA